jgi:hypothetical protein
LSPAKVGAARPIGNRAGARADMAAGSERAE